VNGKVELSAEEIKLKGEQYTILSMLIGFGNKTDKFCESAKVIAEQFVPLSDDERAAKLEELKEFAPRTPSSREIHPGIKTDWCGWDP